MHINKFSDYSAALIPSVHKKRPPIPFVSKVKKMDKVYGTYTNKSEWINLEFLIDPDKSA
jgi:hypothetical protein